MYSQTDLTHMQASLDALEAAQAQAQANVGGFWQTVGVTVLGDTSSQDANQGLLGQTEIAIGNLAGPQWLEVVSNQRSVENWQAYAASTYKTIQSISPDLADWTFGGVVSATAAQTVTEVKKDASIGLAVATPILLLVGGLYLLIFLGPVLARR